MQPDAFRKLISMVLCMMLVFFNFPLSAPLYAADPLENLPNNNQPEVPALGSQNDPPQNNLSGGSDDPDNPLSPVQPQGMMLMGSSQGTVTVLPGRPNIKSVGYNANGRTRYPGYVRFIPVDNNTFGYAYDLGAAPGATVDIVIGKTGNVMNLSGGYEMRLKRENKNPATGGISAITIIFRDNTGKEYSERIQLSADYQNYAFDLSGKNINAAAISEIILRQTYEDIAVATYQEDRRGQIFVNVGGLEVQHGIDGTTLDTAALSQLPQSTGVSARGFIRGAHTVPGYITLLNELSGTRGFRYDVGGSDGAVVQTNLWPPTGGVLALGATFVMAMKNSGNGAKTLLRFKDIAGKVREFVLNLTDAYQNFVMNLEDPLDPANGFDYNHITQVDIEVTRALSRARRGQIDFYIPRSQEDPFTDVVPVIDSIQVTSSGAGVVNFEPITGAAVYQVQIAKDANFTDIIHEGYPQDPIEPFQINQSGTYYARVRGSKNINVTVGPVTQWKAQSFSADVIYDKKPAVDSAVTNAGGVTEIMYAPVPGAIVYHVQVATDAAFTNIVHEGYPNGAFENVNLGQDRTYYVRVRGSASTDLNLGYVSQWSDAFEFIRDMTNRNINPDSSLDSADITNMPNGQAGAPGVTSVGPGGDATDAAQATDRGVIVTYNTGTAGWAGGGFSYDDFTTTPKETGNLSAMTQLIFGVRGDADSVKFEIVDDDGKSDYVYLRNISATAEKFWSIPTALFHDVDLTKVRLLYFIVEGTQKQGQLIINRVPQDPFTQIVPNITSAGALASGAGTVAFDAVPGAVIYQVQVAKDANFTDLVYEGYPTGSSESFRVRESITYHVRVRASKNIDVGVGPATQWAVQTFAADVIYDKKPVISSVATSNETGLTTVNYSALTGAALYQVQISRDENFTDIAYEGVFAETAPSFYLQENGSYYARVRASASTDFSVNAFSQWADTYPFTRNIDNRNLHPDANLDGYDISNFPDGEAGPLGVTSVAPASGATSSATVTRRGVKIDYNTNSAGWAGGGFTYDDFGTPAYESGNLSSLNNLVFGIKGNASKVKLEIIDKAGKSSFVYLMDIRADAEQFWSVPTGLFSGIDLAHIRMMYFVVEGQQQQGQLFINNITQATEISPDPALTETHITNLPDGQAGAPGVTSVGPGGDATDAAVATERGVKVTYNTGTAGWAGGGFSYDNFSTTPFESGNISALSQLVFGIKGNASSVKFELADDQGHSAHVYLNNISATEEKFWSIPASLFAGVDLTHLRLMYFIVEGANQQGELFINRMPSVISINPDPNLTQSDITKLPLLNNGERPVMNAFASEENDVATADVTVNVVSEEFAGFTYESSNAGGYGGVFLTYDNAATTSVESINFNSTFPNGLVLQFDSHDGDSPNPPPLDHAFAYLMFELTDASGAKSVVKLTGSETFAQRWKIKASDFRGIDLAHIQTLSMFVLGDARAAFYVQWGNFAYIPVIGDDPTNPAITLVPKNGLGARPVLTNFASTQDPNGNPDTSSSAVTMTSPTAALLDLNLKLASSFGGAFFSYDNAATTTTIETINLNTDFPTGMVLGLNDGGTGLAEVKVEITDSTGKKDRVRLVGMTGATKRWKIPLSNFDEVDLTKIQSIAIVAEGIQSNKKLNVDWGEFAYRESINPDPNLTADDMTLLPDGQAGAPGVTSVGPGGDATDAAVATERGVKVTYNTGTPGWAGGGFSYDDFSTTPVEHGNISSLSNLVFGIKGNASTLKLELVDDQGHSAYVHLNNVSATEEKFWSIPASLFAGVDLTHLRLIYFIVEGANQQGELFINRMPPSEAINPDPSLNVYNISLLPNGQAGAPGVTSVGPGGGATDSAQATDRGVIVTYNTGTPGWAGGGFSYDDFSTTPVEYGNISSLGNLVFGIKGNASTLKLELVDDQGHSAYVHLNNVSATEEKFWSIPAARFAGVDLTHLRLIYFIVEGANQQGQLTVNRLPPTAEIIPDPNLTGHDITNLPNGQIGAPGVTSVGPGTVGTFDAATATARGVIVDYITGTPGWAGGGFSYDDFQTQAYETGDLSGMSQLVFGVQSQATSLKLEIVDDQGKTAHVYLRNVRSDIEQYYAIPIAALFGIDLTHVRLIYFIVEGQNQVGQIIVNRVPTP